RAATIRMPMEGTGIPRSQQVKRPGGPLPGQVPRRTVTSAASFAAPAWGCSSAGRALESHSRGHRCDPGQLHQSPHTSRRERGGALLAGSQKCILPMTCPGNRRRMPAGVTGGTMNSKRIIVGGLVAGVFIAVAETVLSLLFTSQRFQAELSALGIKMQMT